MGSSTELERILAYAGIVLWITFVVLSVLPPWDPIGAAIGTFATVASTRELARWRRGERHATGKKAGQPVYPALAWFGCGAVTATILEAIVVGIAVGPQLAPRSDDLFLVHAAVWLAGGFATEWFLVGRAKRRAAAAVPAVPLPPPPPGAPARPQAPAVGPIERRSEIPTQPTPARPGDPRGRS